MKNVTPEFRDTHGSRWFLFVTAFLAGWYISLCLLHLFSQRPLWMDEEWVFASLNSFSATEMFTRPLLHIQMFPRLYLFMVQKFSQVFDYHLISLRLPSFICMIAAFVLWLRIVRLEFPHRLHYFLFVLSWSSSAVFLYYAAELKPYSMDVLVGALFITFLYHQKSLEEKGGGRYLMILMGLPFLAWFSYMTYLFLVFPFWNLVLSVKKKRGQMKFLIAFVLAMLTAGGLSYLCDLRFQHGNDLTDHYRMMGYFISFESFGEFLRTLGDGTMNLFARFHVERPRLFKGMMIGFAVFGIGYMFYAFLRHFRQGKAFGNISAVALILYFELFLLGALEKYPFTVPRNSLFFAPFVHFLILKGVLEVQRLNVFVGAGLLGFYVLFLMVCAVGLSRLALAGQFHFQPVVW